MKGQPRPRQASILARSRARNAAGHAASDRIVRCACGTTFSDDEHRCPHCGRRVQAVTMPDAVTSVAVPEPGRADAPRPASKTAHQPYLFAGPKVIPFDTLVSTRRSPRKREAAPERRSPPAPQAALDFRPPVDREESAEYAPGEIALPSDRVKAALIDLVISLAAAGVFALTFYALGGDFSAAKRALPAWTMTAILLGLIYHLFFAYLNRNTPGMSACGLHLLTFDSARPETRRRIARLLAACLSVTAVGLGLIWALFDEENLTWHDHMTKTYLAKRG